MFPSKRNTTCEMPATAVALAVTVTVPDTGPALGVVRVITGGVIGLFTVTVTPPEVVVWPRTSVAIAVSVWEPFVTVVVFHWPVKLGPAPLTGAPTFLLSTWNCTVDMPAAAEALAVTLIVPRTE